MRLMAGSWRLAAAIAIIFTTVSCAAGAYYVYHEEREFAEHYAHVNGLGTCHRF